MVFAVHQLQEKWQEQNQGLHMVFVDLAKALTLLIWRVCGKSFANLATQEGWSYSLPFSIMEC